LPIPRTVFIFPAFVSDYLEDQSREITGFTNVFYPLLEQAATLIDPELFEFHPVTKNFLDQELRNQLISYIQSYSCARLLRSRNIIPDFLAGYSMGLYGALTDAGSISFKEGLFLIINAFENIFSTIREGDFSMGIVIGLNKEDIKGLISKTDPLTEISNQNSEFSFVLSGTTGSLAALLKMAKEEGAIHTRKMQVGIPYHSNFLKEASTGFSTFVHSIPIRQPTVPVISVIDQTLIDSPGRCSTELIRNLFQPFNWYQTHLKLVGLGVKTFIESGPVPGLVKIARFIPGNASYMTVLAALSAPPVSDL